MINAEEIKEIQRQFNKVISHVANIPEPHTDNLFDKFLMAKHHIIALFGGDLIYELPEPVYFNLNQEAKEEGLNSFLDKVYDTYNLPKLWTFLDATKKGFYQNEVPEEITCPGIGSESYITIPKGMKIVKAFKYFIEDKDLLTTVQNEASMLVQKDKIKGHLCFSVHPLDFLSTSENACNWRSCHSLDGDYRSGNLSYMLDRSTMICYLRSDEEVQLPNFPADVLWNNKKWRMLIHLEDRWRGIMLGRQYPFTSEEAKELVMKTFCQKFNFDLRAYKDTHFSELLFDENGNFCSDIQRMVDENEPGHVKVLNDEYLLIGNAIRPVSDVISDGENSLMYNDLTRSTCYKRIWALNFFASSTSAHWTIGAEVPCLACGEEPIENSDSFCCSGCQITYGEKAFGYCMCCDNPVYEDTVIVLSNGDYVCPSCFEYSCGWCSDCGEGFYLSDLKYYKEDDEQGMLCETCMEARESRKTSKKIANIFKRMKEN